MNGIRARLKSPSELAAFMRLLHDTDADVVLLQEVRFPSASPKQRQRPGGASAPPSTATATLSNATSSSCRIEGRATPPRALPEQRRAAAVPSVLVVGRHRIRGHPHPRAHAPQTRTYPPPPPPPPPPSVVTKAMAAASLGPIQPERRRARSQPRQRRTCGGAALRPVHARAHVSEHRGRSCAAVLACLMMVGLNAAPFYGSYAPNNGHSDASRQRRIEWDQRMTELAERLRRDNQCLIWAGGRA